MDKVEPKFQGAYDGYIYNHAIAVAELVRKSLKIWNVYNTDVETFEQL